MFFVRNSMNFCSILRVFTRRTRKREFLTAKPCLRPIGYATFYGSWLVVRGSGGSFRFSSYLAPRNLVPAAILLRKEVIQPHLPIRLPCYDFTPVASFTFDGSLLSVKSPASGASNSHGVTGGVYKARERIHRDMLIRDY